MKKTLVRLLVLLSLGGGLCAQAEVPDAAAPSFEAAADDVRKQLIASTEELASLRAAMAAEQVPLSRRLSELNAELLSLKEEFQGTTRLLDSRTLDLSNLSSEIALRKDEASYISSLLGEYIRGFEAALHIAELQRFETPLETAQLAMENRDLSQGEVFDAQVTLVQTSIERLFEALGGTRFEGSAVNSEGLVERGIFALVGPTAVFRASRSGECGTAEQRLGSLEPALIGFELEQDSLAVGQLIETGEGYFPIDTTMGNAHKMEATNESFIEHAKRGGPVMFPIVGMAAAALLVALCKWIAFLAVRRPTRGQIEGIMTAVKERDLDAAEVRAAALKGPLGRMLSAGVEHIREPRQLIEEVMFEKVLTTRLKLQSWLPFIAICAASAPLLGLLGTVTGIINTFKLITVFGSGDVKSLSGGISEALITTKFGLIVAIPSLLLHAFLSRKAKGVTNDMEQAAIVFVNQVSKTYPGSGAGEGGAESAPPPGEEGSAIEAGHVRAQVKQALGELLSPLTDDSSAALPGQPAPPPTGV